MTTDACTAPSPTIYPVAIQRACAALDESPVFRDLPDGYFRVVLRLFMKINLAQLAAPFVASRTTLARESGRSVETVGRAIAWLEERKLITRAQKAQPGLRGSCAPITPTKRLLAALEFRGGTGVRSDMKPPNTGDTTPKQPPFGYPQDNAGLAVKSDGSISLPPEGLQSKETTGVTGSPVKPQEKAKTVVVGKFRLPADLAPLVVDQGLAPTGLLSLMAIARKAGQRLSDVVAVAKNWLIGLQGRQLYAYLLTLIRQGKDFRYIRAVEADAAAMRAKVANDEQRVKAKSIDWIGRRFVCVDRSVVTVEAGGWLRFQAPDRLGRVIESSRKLDIAFVNAVERGQAQPVV